MLVGTTEFLTVIWTSVPCLWWWSRITLGFLRRQSQLLCHQEDVLNLPWQRAISTAWWIPGDYDTQGIKIHKDYHASGIQSALHAAVSSNLSELSFQIPGVQTSLQLKTDDGIYINLHEAFMVNHPAMHLNLDDKTMTFTSWLTHDAQRWRDICRLRSKSPWRTMGHYKCYLKVLSSNDSQPQWAFARSKDTSLGSLMKYIRCMVGDDFRWGRVGLYPWLSYLWS